MAGFFRYFRFIIRRERIMSSIWIGLMVVFTLLIAAVFPSLMGDSVSKLAMVEMMKSPAYVSMLGPVFDTDNYTVGMVFANMMSIWIMITIAVMNIFFISRHTRVDEEHGRLEMLRSLPVGRLTNTAATLFASVVLNIIIAVFCTIAILIVNFEGCSFLGAFSYSFAICAFGIVMAAITLVSVQLFSTSRAVSGVAFVALGVFYLMRLAGDNTDAAISYVSPMGLGLRAYAFHKNNLIPILILLVQSIVFSAVAFMLCLRRDLGEGIFPARKGRGSARAALLSPLGFAINITKNSTIVWSAVVFIISAMYGSMLGDIESFVEANEFFKQMLAADSSLGNSLTESFIAMLMMILAHIAAIPVIITAGKLRSEESRGRLDQIIGRAVRRDELILIFMAIAFVESILFMISTVLGLYIAGYSVEVISFGSLMAAGMCYLPSVWILASIGIFLTGAFPKGGVIVWALYSYSFFVLYLGKMFQLPDIFNYFSPFNFSPKLPIEEFSILPLIMQTLFSIGLVALGVVFFKKRDLVNH